VIKEEKLQENFSKIIVQFMGGKGYIPMTAGELIYKLSITEQHETLFLKTLRLLVREGEVELIKTRYSLVLDQTDVISGTLSVHPRGFAFLRPDNATLCPQDVFIPKHLTKNAVDGDTVEVIVNWESVSQKGPEGRVVSITKRGRTHIAGTVSHVDDGGTISAHVPILGTEQEVHVQPSEDFDLREGDRIIMKVTRWGGPDAPTECTVHHLLGHVNDPTVDISAAIEEFQIRSDFPSRVTAEAKKVSSRVSTKEIGEREDLREWECVTIDPDTAKDFDDALSLEVDEKGHYHLGVHIADVTHYVKPFSPIDNEAKKRCNSTYFPGTCVPMLPPVLADNICSLRANVNRLVVSVHMQFNRRGRLVNSRIARSVIKSKKRFTCRDALAVLEGKKSSKHAPLLKNMVKLCNLLKKKRYDRGSIEFAMPENAVKMGDDGIPTGMDVIQYDITHQMVEEFMLKANEVVAQTLSKQGKTLPYRVHEEPPQDNFKEFAKLAHAFGFNIAESPTNEEIQAFFDTLGDSPYSQHMATSFIRCMRLAQYSPENIGHYGLSLEYYCHFTSPIRRYADLVVHRILFGDPVDDEELQHISNSCSDQERVSGRAESAVKLLKKLRLLWKLEQEDPYRTYPAVITRVRHFGIFFEVDNLAVEGMVHISDLGNEYFAYDERRMKITGTRSGLTFECGTKIDVALSSIDFITLESQWYIVADEAPEPKKKKGKKQWKKSRKRRRK
jgi:ribonuclease R